MDVSVESKSLPSVGYSRKSYLQTTSQRLARDKLVHLNGRRSLALSSVGPGGLQGDFGNLDIKYLNQNIPEDLKMSVANIRKLQENTAAVQHSAFSLDRMKFLPGWNFYSDGNPTRMAFLPGWNSYPDGNELDVDQLASDSASSAGSLSQLSKLKTEGVSWPCKFKRSNEGCGSHADEGDFGAKGEGIQEAQMLRGDEYKSFGSHHLHTRIIFGGVSELNRFGTGSAPWLAAFVSHEEHLPFFVWFSLIREPVQHHSWQPLSAMRNTCLSLSGSHSSRRLARDHRYASLALVVEFRLARDHSESHRSGGSGEGPQIGNSAGDRTQNLWFHKRIKLELELGISEHMGLLIEIDLGSRAWIRIGDRLLAEITDTMASLRDAILGLGQRIDGHQAQPLPIPGSTLHDSTTTTTTTTTIWAIWTYYTQDYIVPPPPPPPVQSAPQAGAFVLHGQTETTPHSVVAPHRLLMIPRLVLID
ncbi:hypothetical protein CK203_066034 [Vitis vinifera]|uniref:Uncharacterized protein n=1 Tax=Vitis vinifera TaxID=29760 RepID=A0A438G4I3_VITVI|nr:hypothetical protein CK203_066034 [Vitis vinifera]